MYFIVLLCMTVSLVVCFFFFFKQNTSYDLRIMDWSSDVCSSDLFGFVHASDGLVSQFLGGGRDFLALLQLAFDLFGNRLNRVQLQIERSFHLSGNLCRRLVFGTHNKCSCVGMSLGGDFRPKC